jgi:arabinoxylan arabinofuranohydrolase
MLGHSKYCYPSPPNLYQDYIAHFAIIHTVAVLKIFGIPTIPALMRLVYNINNFIKTGGVMEIPQKLLFLVTVAIIFAGAAFAENPLIQQKFTADPNPFVWNDRLYVYCSYDNNNPTTSGYDIRFYTLISSDDMANWTDHGEVFSVKRDMKWANNCYAPGAAVRDGKVYLYVPDGGSSIGVVSADRPEGPFTDPNGKTLISKNSQMNTNVPWLFDPAGFIDGDGQGYLYFGGGDTQTGENLRVIKLNANMTSTSGNATTISGATRSFEAAYMHKYNNTYYFSYSQNFDGAADIAYMTGNSPMGPFTFRGSMVPNGAVVGNGNNHAGVVQYKNNWYVFYHDRRLRDAQNPKPDGERRSVSVDKLEYNTDGTIKKATLPTDGPAQIKNFNPYDTVLATTINRQSGTIKTAICSAPNPGTITNNNTGTSAGTAGDRDVMLISITNNSWVRLKGVDFGTAGAAKFYVSAASASAGGSIEIRTGSNTGTLVGTCNIGATGGLTTWKEIECDITGATGVKDYLYLVFKTTAADQFRLRWYKFGVSGAVKTYTLTVEKSPADGGTTAPASGQTGITAGSQVNISATAATGYSFSNWTITGSGTLVDANSASTKVTVNGNVTVRANFTALPVEPDSNGYYFYHPFEASATETHDWTGRYGPTVANTGAQKANGSRALAVTGRTETYQGAMYSLNPNAFVPGNSYSFSVLAMHSDGAADDKFKFTMQYDIGDSTHYVKIDSTVAGQNSWVMLKNAYFAIPADATGMAIYVEMPENASADFYIDDAMGGVVGTPAPGKGTSVRGGKISSRGQSPLVTVRARTLAVNAPDGSGVRVRVVNLNGKTVAAFNSTGSANFSLRKIPAGAYIVEAATGGHKAISAIVLK